MESRMRGFVNTYDENWRWKHEFPQQGRKAPRPQPFAGRGGRCDPLLPGLSPSAAVRRLKDKRYPLALSVRLRFRPPCCSNARVSLSRRKGPRKRARALVRCRFCAARTMACAAQLRSDVLTVFPNTLLRFYGEAARETAGLSHGIRLTCGICSASETSRRERRDCAFLPDARRVEDIGPYSRRTLDAEHVCPNPLSYRRHWKESPY